MKTILIVDDHPAVLEGLKNVLTKEGYHVVLSATSEEALLNARKFPKPDLLVVDLFIEGVADGIDIIKKIRLQEPNVPAIVYTMHYEPWVVSMLTESSVEGIVLKGDPINELIKAVRTVVSGKTYKSKAVENLMETIGQTRESLSPKDIQVLQRIASGESTKHIAEMMNLSEKTVEYHRSNILKRLEVKNMNEAILTAVRLGIIS